MLARFERLMEQAVEGSLRRIFPSALQPVQLAKAAARAMEESRVVGLRGAEVPNVYRVHLASADLERFGGYTDQLSAELKDYLVAYARDRGLRPIDTIAVEVLNDPRMRTGGFRVEAEFVAASRERGAEVSDAQQHTRQLRLAELAAAGGAASREQSEHAAPTLWLSGSGGIRYALDPDALLVRIGRAVDNDLVLEQPRVSRYHAQLRRVDATWLVYDLDSTNGTFVAETRVSASQPEALRPDAALRLGDFDLYVTARAPKAEA